jgi:putative oxidoreductase
MGSRRLGRALVFLGIFAIIASMGWWASYYNLVIGALGEKPALVHPMGCLLWTSDLCAQAQATSKLAANFPAYNPLVLWVSLAILVLGLVIVARSTSTDPVPVTPAGEPRLFISGLEPFYAWSRDLSWPIVRVAVAGALLTHGIGKLTGTTIATFASGSMARRGLEPSTVLAYIIFFNESAGAILVAVGLLTRFAAASIAIEMFIIAFVAHFANGFGWANPRGGWEFPLLWGMIFFAIALRGGGPYSLDRLLRREL